MTRLILDSNFNAITRNVPMMYFNFTRILNKLHNLVARLLPGNPMHCRVRLNISSCFVLLGFLFGLEISGAESLRITETEAMLTVSQGDAIVLVYNGCNLLDVF